MIVAGIQLYPGSAKNPSAVHFLDALVHRGAQHVEFLVVEWPKRAIATAIERGNSRVHVEGKRSR